MSYYIIGIGGTGAKCVESFIHLCAAGFMPSDGKTLFAMFVDPDGANGSLGRAQALLKQYYDCRDIHLGNTDLFKTPIRIADPDVWSPLNDKPQQLDDFFSYNVLRAQNPPAAHLFDVLYSEREKTTPLERGFRGHPSIGAAVMAATVELEEEEPWITLRDQIAQDVGNGQEARVILCGSIFGGTGASGVPTIARLVDSVFRSAADGNNQPNFKLGGVLMLPYFSFDKVQEEGIKANAEDFLLNTQTALKYYHQQDDLNVFDAVYLLGNDTLTSVRASSLGGNTQDNEPHLLELYAALAALNFFSANTVSDYPMLARSENNKFAWPDLPWHEGTETLKRKVNQLARFSFSYLSSYHPMLQDIRKNGNSYRAPWYVNFFERQRVDLKSGLDTELEQVRNYCDGFLLWLANLEFSVSGTAPTGEGDDGHLVNYLAFAEIVKDARKKDVIKLKKSGEAYAFIPSALDNLLLPQSQTKRPHALGALWDRMSNARLNPSAEKIGAFVHALYRECGYF